MLSDDKDRAETLGDEEFAGASGTRPDEPEAAPEPADAGTAGLGQPGDGDQKNPADLFDESAFGRDEAAEESDEADEPAEPAPAAPAPAKGKGARRAPAADAADAEPEPRDRDKTHMKWYVLHANTGHENKVKRNIEMAIRSNHMESHFGDVLVATQEVTEMKNGKRSTVKRKFFPSYILIEMEMTKETQHFINSVPGVTRFVGGTEQRPLPISQEEVDRILGRMSKAPEAKTVLEIPYEIGDSVQVIDGPFTDWIGVINEINHDKGKLKVMISIFGSETPVELDFLQVKAI